MVVIAQPPPSLPSNIISLFYVLDDLLSRSPILVFYGPSATPTAATGNNSRIQAHIYSPAGFQSYPRLTISPTSPLYAAVNCLPREEQGDDICRGLAFSLYKYFAELPLHVKNVWESECTCKSNSSKFRAAPPLFSDAHAAILASRMSKVDNVADTIQHVRQALAEQSISWLDMDVILPFGSMRDVDLKDRGSNASVLEPSAYAQLRYGEYSDVVSLLGDAAFLPTSRLRRAPSQPTSLNKSLLFTKQQKENIRREMCELLDTEESYLAKLDHLVGSIASEFRDKAKSKAQSSTSPSYAALASLFPASLDQILEVNASFLDAIRQVVENTENAAIADIEASDNTTSYNPSNSSSSSPSHSDLTGALALSSSLRTWFPKFSACYLSYTKAHSQFPQILKNFTKDAYSSFSKRVQDTGEQRLMSMLIEPVQRLPRYNLFIDNILKQLPARHPAIQPLLKARDTISEICSQDIAVTSPSKVVNNLRRVIQSWPLSVKPIGRLVSAIDSVELTPPYRHNQPDQINQASHCILLLFTDFFVILAKLGKSSFNARNLLAIVDAPELSLPDQKMDELSFKQAYHLNSLEFTEFDSGKMLQMMSITAPFSTGRPSSRQTSQSFALHQTQTFLLSGMHEGKAARITEDIVKARVEGRYAEAERESPKWEVRSASGNDLTFFIALSEECQPLPMGRGFPSNIQVYVEPKKFKTPPFSQNGEICASLSQLGDGLFTLEIFGPNEFSSQDTLTSSEFLPVLSKRLTNVLQIKTQIKTSSHTKSLFLRNQTILQSLRIVTTSMVDGGHYREKLRPPSPVKLLANIFGGSTREQHRKHGTTLSLSDIPQLTPMRRRISDEVSIRSEKTHHTQAASSALEKLEETFSSYILALQARKGNIVGKVLRARLLADELIVNELYNTLLEDPDNYQLAAQVPVDILFASFEKFMKVAWQDKMGCLFSLNAWHGIHTKLDSYQPGEFEDTFRKIFMEMSPQNQRAVKATVKLLVDLLEGTGNDGDRGSLTASFADVMVPTGGNAHQFVALLDRLVEDIDPLLLNRPYAGHGINVPSDGNPKSNNTGSLTSSTSSLRRKFASLTRMGSKNQSNESESETLSVWRTLSKSKPGNDSQSASLSKSSSLNRLNTTDSINAVASSPKRPNSRDRPTVLGAFTFENSRPLSTIGEGHGTDQRPRKKRRSSLSDLTALHASAATTAGFITPRTPNKIDSSFLSNQSPHTPHTPSPSKPSFIPQPSVSYHNGSGRSLLPNRRDNSPVRSMVPLAISPPKLNPTVDESSITTSPQRRNTNSSAIPTLRHALPGGLGERPISGNARKLPAPPVALEKTNTVEKVAPLNPTAGKLRMQSPQKIRERLAAEQRTVTAAENELQGDIIKLKDDGSTLRKPRSGVSGSPSRHSSGPTSPASEASMRLLESKLATIASKHTTHLFSLKARLDSLATDVNSSLLVSEKRAKGLDELYREANAENEALYSRFNDELAKVLALVKGGEGVRENGRRAREVEEENSKLRKENGRLRREVVGLRAQLRE